MKNFFKRNKSLIAFTIILLAIAAILFAFNFFVISTIVVSIATALFTPSIMYQSKKVAILFILVLVLGVIITKSVIDFHLFSGNFVEKFEGITFKDKEGNKITTEGGEITFENADGTEKNTMIPSGFEVYTPSGLAK